MSRVRAVFASVPAKKPGRPQFVGIAEVPGFPTPKIDNEGPRFGVDDRLLSRPRTVIERWQDTQSFSSPHAALDRLAPYPDVPSNIYPGGVASLEPAAQFRCVPVLNSL